MEKIFYFCDGKCRCGSSPYCGMSQQTTILEPVCYHTTQPEHAVNGAIYENSDKRPYFVPDPNNSNYVWEGFVGDGKIKLLECGTNVGNSQN